MSKTRNKQLRKKMATPSFPIDSQAPTSQTGKRRAFNPDLQQNRGDFGDFGEIHDFMTY